ncbi:hypothetical protein PVL29_019422 [Vitis rotundifolia]|uniref:Uncharacterized protein n=1 Tax=Vitis rotundifolia TaxID=103349 RepID=A0AA38Z192_VITRO|nr:hypothetical protein PVL29_019422 [Vitis rotundifolia]
MAANDIKRNVRANKRLFGNCFSKSFRLCLGVRMPRNAITEVIEHERAIRDEMAKTMKPGSCLRFGVLPPSSIPPGMLAIVAKATVVTTVATREHELEVLISDSLPSFTNSLCDSLNICFAVLCSLLKIIQKSRGIEFFTYCGQFQVVPLN